MARTAVVRSASLAPADAELVDDLAAELSHGSFTELTRTLLYTFGVPLKQRLEELRESGIEPSERLFITRPTPADTEAQVQDFYAPSSWPEAGARSHSPR